MNKDVEARNARIEAASFHTSGLVISEAQDMALGDVVTAMMAVALIVGEAADRHPDLNGEDLAAIFRTFGRQVQQVRDIAPFATHATAVPRDALH